MVRFSFRGFQYFDSRVFPDTQYHPLPRGNRGSGVAGIYTIIADQGYGRGVPRIFTPGSNPKDGMTKPKKKGIAVNGIQALEGERRRDAFIDGLLPPTTSC